MNAPTGSSPIVEVRPLGFPWQTVDPFLFCVHHDDAYPRGNEVMGPAASLAGRNLGEDFAGKDGWRMYHGETVPGFPQHPHRGFETVTLVRRGLIDHSDSLGAAARFGRGDAQWLTAGRGICHSEMFPLVDKDKPNPVELFQIWLNLPREKKLAQPHFSMLWNHAIPRVAIADSNARNIEVTLVAGALNGKTPPAPPPDSWASQPGSDVAIWTIRMDPGARWTLPAAAGDKTLRMLAFFRGDAMRVAGTALRAQSAAILRGNSAVELEAGETACELLLLQGKPIAEPVVQYGPFVMNTQAEIQQAMADYRRTRFGGWPWPKDDPVHAREEGRFARHVDGRIERVAE